MKENLLTSEECKHGVQRVSLNVSTLYSDEKGREEFDKKLPKFLKSHPAHSKIFEPTPTGDVLTYLTEHIIPNKRDQRPPLLLVFGNPASHSVASGMFFSYEGNGQEHRFWKALCKADILSFPPAANGNSTDELNRFRKKRLYELLYYSPFRIGLAVYYTMPSPASGKWAGISGLRRLFGNKALTKICAREKDRIDRIIREFVSPSGAVIAFQKDAYLAIKSSTSADYTLDKAKAGSLIGKCQCDSDVRLFCLPPTRLLLGFVDLLHGVSLWVLNKI